MTLPITQYIKQTMTITLTQREPRLMLGRGSIVFLALLVLPFIALFPAEYPLAISTYTLSLIGKN
ncbi:urea ABC transporter permease subunit UrtC, partial [Pectobacterium brasiliense]|nr:urea ABC transporter permease subunit UrtC [Pectobacterium brasiliense]